MVLFIEVKDCNSGATIQVNVNAIKSLLPMGDPTAKEIALRYFTKIVVEGVDGGYKTHETQAQIIEKIGKVQGQWPVYSPTEKGEDNDSNEGEDSAPRSTEEIVNPLKRSRKV